MQVNHYIKGEIVDNREHGDKCQKIVFKIFNKEHGNYEGVYSRAYHDEYEFTSEEDARTSNCHEIYQDKAHYDIHKYKVTYERIK